MKKMSLLVLCLFALLGICLQLNIVQAYPFAYSSFDSGRVTNLIEIYSDDETTAYIGEDTVIANLIYGQYRENGKLKTTIYIHPESNKYRSAAIGVLNKLIEDNKVDFYRANSSGLQYIAFDIFRDPTNNALTVHKESFFNDYNIIIGNMETLICLHSIEYTYDLDNNKENLLMKLIKNTDNILDALKNNPKYSIPR